MNPCLDIVEGDRVTLTCDSDANPPAWYSWSRKKKVTHHYKPELVLQYVQSSDSGEYFCTAENELGKSTSHILINVKCKDLKCPEFM